MSRFARSLELFRSSLKVLRADRELVVLPVVSAVVSMVVLATFAVPGWFSLHEVTATDVTTGNETTSLAPTVLTFVIGIAFYIVAAFVVVFFNAALMFAANERFEGGNPTLGSALAGAWSHRGAILRWAVVSAVVSMVIKQIQEQGGLLGRLVGGLLGFAWTTATFIVVPTMVVEGVGVREAFKRSTESIRSTWGENLIGQGGLGLVQALASLPCLAVGILGAYLLDTSVALGIAVIAVAAIAFFGVAIVMTALGAIFQTALYRFASHKEIPEFDPALLTSAFGPKPA